MEVTIKSITTTDICQYVAEFARVCTRRDEKPSTPDQDFERCKSLWKMGHGTPFESINIDFLVEDVSRSLLAQITRYRHASFNVESQRYVNYKERLELIYPDGCKDITVGNGKEFGAFVQDLYHGLIENGAKPEDARCVLPNATPTRFRMVVNLREFFHIYQQRSNSHAQREIRDLVELIFNKLSMHVDNNSQKLLTFIQKNVKLSIRGLIEDIEKLLEVNNGQIVIENVYGELERIVAEYKELI